mgnify:CR=1 FL=1
MVFNGWIGMLLMGFQQVAGILRRINPSSSPSEVDNRPDERIF